MTMEGHGWRIFCREQNQQLPCWLMKEFILPTKPSMFAIAAQQDVKKISMELFQTLIIYYLIWKQIALVYRLLVLEELPLQFVERTELLRVPGFLAKFTNVMGLGACSSGRQFLFFLFLVEKKGCVLMGKCPNGQIGWDLQISDDKSFLFIPFFF